MSIADRFTHRNNLWHNTLRLESPEVRANPPEANLYFVGYAYSSRVSHITVHFFEIVIGQHELAAAAHQRLADERRHIALALLDSLLNMISVFLSRLRIGPLVLPAIDVGHRHFVYISGWT